MAEANYFVDFDKNEVKFTLPSNGRISDSVILLVK